MLLEKTAIFWDYENVPLRKKDWNKFLHALDFMMKSIECRFKRVYVSEGRLTEEKKKILSKKGFSFKFVSSTGKNAVDYSMMRSTIDVLRKKAQLKQVVMITGDSDFKELISALPNHRIIIICQKNNYSKSLIETVDEAYSVNHLVKNPNKWFFSNLSSS